ncbi:ATP-binding protein [Geodermatophilus sp. SYSU D01036]
MAPTACIRLFGRVQVQLDEVSSGTLRSGRAESLLACLVLRRGVPVSRERLAAVLWPDSEEGQARTNLRHLVHSLRRDLPAVDRYLETTARTLCWRAEEPLWLDVTAFERLLDGSCDAPPAKVTALREAVALYRGELVDGCDDEWLREDRERLRRRYRQALGELAALTEAGGDATAAVALAERMVRDDPLAEDGYRLLMRVHSSGGDRTSALRAYHQCVTALESELSVEPSAETRRAYQELVAAEYPAATTVRMAGPPLVGRTAERAHLAEVWRAAEAGAARFVLVTGEAGIGKTRLVEEYRAWCARRGAAVADARCYLAEGPLAYGPVVDWLRRPALRASLRALEEARLTELSRLLPELLDEVPDLVEPPPLPETEQRSRLFDAVAAAVLGPGRPVLLVVDDLPHADRETCRLLHHLLRSHRRARLVVAATARTEDVEVTPHVRALLTGLRDQDLLTAIELAPFTPEETATLAERLTGARPSAEDTRRLHRQTEGNPLFVVEALRAGERGGDALTPRVQALIEARLAQLGDAARAVLACAAAIGREFHPDVLAAASGVDEDTLVTGLDELWRRRVVRQHGTDGQAPTYDFAHDRIREVAYRGIGPARRRLLHGRIAAALEQLHRTAAEPVSAQIAAHHERAGATAEAVAWYGRAAAAAQLLHANGRAVQLLDRALALVGSLPASPDRDRVELELRTAALAPLVPLVGYTSRGITTTQRRATELARSLGVDLSPQLVRSLALHALTRADFAAATRCGRQLRAAGERRGDDVLVVEGDYVLGVAAFWQADLTAARRHLESAVRRYRPEDRTTHLLHYGQDPKVVCLGRLACTYWFLGLPADARRAHTAALAWSREVADPFSRLVALTFGALLALETGDEAELRRLTAELAEMGSDGINGDVTRAFTGYLAVLDGQGRAGLDSVHTALAHAAVAAAAPGQHAMIQRVLLAAQLAAGDTAAARAAADRLLAMDGPARLWAPLAGRVHADLSVST